LVVTFLNVSFGANVVVFVVFPRLAPFNLFRLGIYKRQLLEYILKGFSRSQSQQSISETHLRKKKQVLTYQKKRTLIGAGSNVEDGSAARTVAEQASSTP
jgi:hypothetical protein